MLSRIDPRTIRFAAPEALWLLVVPSVLLLVWVWQAVRRAGDTQRMARERRVPVRERFPLVGDLLFWLALILALAAAVVALAQPQAVVSIVRTAGIDLVILQDGSASMRVGDVAGDRWQRSIRFLRTLAESLRWKEDRVALALFAHVATPQVRLTKDPNTLLFFLDHLAREPPFRLEDDSTWDTNIEVGIYWGLRLIEKDEQLHGSSRNARTFVLVSDGQAWSGEVEKSLKIARQRGIPLFVVGAGTTAGGVIPEPARRPDDPASAGDAGPIHSALDRASLQTIAAAGGGQYRELDEGSDSEIANTIIDATRRRAGSRGVEETTEDLSWRFLFGAAFLLLLGGCFVRDRADLWIQAVGAAAALAVLVTLTW